MPINTKDREYREIRVADLEIREEQDGKKFVEGYATTFDQEYRLWGDERFQVLESVDRHAFDSADMSDVIMQYDHEGRVFARLSNGTLELTADEHGLKMRADLGGTEIGRQLYEEIRGGYTTKMSFGFSVKKTERKEERDEITGNITVHRKILEIKKLYDVSAVSLPANDATEISARNIGEGVIAEVEQELLAIEARKRKQNQIAITAKSF
ncbi:MAG: HK97 family phage prohead protease [Clostridia bacterium]|nr:HK97 family phage prohead protease [Clostridia bacterium]